MNWKKMIEKGKHYELAWDVRFDNEKIEEITSFLQGEPLEMFNLFVEEAKAYYIDQKETKTIPERQTKLKGLSDWYKADELFILNGNIQLGDVIRVITNSEWLPEESWKKVNTFMENNLTEQALKEMI